jgi:type II secretory ATPase GspE/PulE/Tfp pilus assembly ATPase PilB-like protein
VTFEGETLNADSGPLVIKVVNGKSTTSTAVPPDDAELYAGELEPNAAEQALETAHARHLAERYRLDFVDLARFSIDHELFRTIPADLTLRYGFVPYRRDGQSLVIVVSDPTDLPMLDELGVLLATPLKVTVGTPSAIQSILKKSENSTRVLEEATESFQLQILREDDGDDSLTVDRLSADSSPVIRLVDTTLYSAIQRRASDIHIETQDDAVHVKYRIDGVLQPAMRPIDKRFHSTIISRVKVMAELDIAEKRVPQDGRFKLRMPGKTIDFRVSIMPSVHGEDAVIRILDKESISEQFHELRLDILGFPEEELRRFRKYIAEPYGMVLVTGPTGSGKTTTLYAALSEIKSIEDKIITIEDPVEYQLRGITQIPINEKKGLTFARGLRSILRHDPDKIMVGEIRDAETAQIAINSALTGHLVFTTVHANNVLDVLGRFLNMGVEAYQFVSALNCVLAQRLVRNICVHCKRQATVSRAQLEESALDPALEHSGLFYEGAGCMECGGTGYRGRTAICELLDLTDTIRELILSKRPTSEIKKAARDDGMRFLRESAVEQVLKGITTLREINKVTFVE